MSDDFIPLNQSTPVQKKWYQGGNRSHNQSGYNNHNQSGYNNRNHGRNRGGPNNRWGNNSRNSSFGSDSNTSFGQERNNIDAYLHPSMLEDPWAKLRQKADEKQT